MANGLMPSFLEGKWSDYKQDGLELLMKPHNIDYIYSQVMSADMNQYQVLEMKPENCLE
jgi:hypothetical protein